jgi:hypothetical protein
MMPLLASTKADAVEKIQRRIKDYAEGKIVNVAEVLRFARR